MSEQTSNSTSGQNVPKSKFRRKSRQEQTAASKLRMERRGEKLDAAREKLAKQKPPKKPGAVKRLAHMEVAQAAYDEGQAMLDALNAQYDDIISWADMYDSASMESKKMIVSCLIRRVEVYRDYRLHIDFNIDFEQFSAGLDISAIAA